MLLLCNLAFLLWHRFNWVAGAKIKCEKAIVCTLLLAFHPLGRLAYCLMLAAEMDHLIGTLKDAGLCKDVHYKELYIPQAELEGACAGFTEYVYKVSHA